MANITIDNDPNWLSRTNCPGGPVHYELDIDPFLDKFPPNCCSAPRLVGLRQVHTDTFSPTIDFTMGDCDWLLKCFHKLLSF